MALRGGHLVGLAQQCELAGLPVPEAEVRFHPKRRWRFDFAWPDRKLALECDGGIWVGGRHGTGQGIERDCEKFSEAAIAGWRVMRVTTGMVKSGQALSLIERALNG
jgi:very-short-patch-repair endonuclease